MTRPDGRAPDELRPVTITRNYIKYAEGSVLIETGDTKIICTASVEPRVPGFLTGTGQGWVTAEYSLLPRSTEERNIRERARGKIGGRTHEIQRLIGRSLRSVTQLDQLGERTIWIDCDVIQADGGTRTASITGGFVALVDALNCLVKDGELDLIPVMDFVAATSVGIAKDRAVLDLCYEEDSNAHVDMNCVLTGQGELVEIQGTGEQFPFSADRLHDMLLLAQIGVDELVEVQMLALGDVGQKLAARLDSNGTKAGSC